MTLVDIDTLASSDVPLADVSVGGASKDKAVKHGDAGDVRCVTPVRKSTLEKHGSRFGMY